MSPDATSRGAARSVLVFGVYMVGQGLLLLVAPNLLLGLFGFPEASEFWVRAVGISLLVLALYYVLAARAGLVPFFRFTVIGRQLQLVLFIGCVAAGLVGWPILLTAGLEALAGLWTAWELRRAGLLTG